MRSVRVFAVLFSVLFICSMAFAQGGATGAISGTLQDSNGAVVTGASVTIVNEGTGQTVRQLKSDASGLFNAPLLPAGTYSVEVSAEGFAVTCSNSHPSVSRSRASEKPASGATKARNVAAARLLAT